MEKTAGQILKASNVNVQGRFQLDIGQGKRTSPNPAPVSATASSAPQVCVIETCPDYAVMEVTCSCGEKTRVKCVYRETGA